MHSERAVAQRRLKAMLKAERRWVLWVWALFMAMFTHVRFFVFVGALVYVCLYGHMYSFPPVCYITQLVLFL